MKKRKIKRVGIPIPKSITAFIPSNLDLDKLLKENPPTFKYHKDNFIYLMDLVYVYFDDTQSEEKGEIYTRLHSALIQRRVRNYRDYFDYLIQNKILFEDKHYIVDKQSRGYSFTFEYSMGMKKVEITYTKLIKKIQTFYNIDNPTPIIDTKKIKIPYLLKWFETGKLKIDFEAGEKYLKDLYLKDITTDSEESVKDSVKHQAMIKYNSRLRPLILLHEGIFNPKIDTTAGRLHSTLTQLKSDLRQFITYDGHPLVSIDIVNSQPYLSTVLLSYEK